MAPPANGGGNFASFNIRKIRVSQGANRILSSSQSSYGWWPFSCKLFRFILTKKKLLILTHEHKMKKKVADNVF